MLFEAKMVTGFPSFYAKRLCLSWVFILLCWVFLAKFSSSSLGLDQKFLCHVYDDPSGWNDMLLKIKSLLFFYIKRQKTKNLPDIQKCIVGWLRKSSL